MTAISAERPLRQLLLTPPQWLLIGIVLIASFVLTMLFWAVIPTGMGENESSDFLHFYAPVARNILAGEGLVTNNGQLAVRYPPGYPILLAGIFGLSGLTSISESTLLAAFTLLCMGLSGVFVLLLARTLWNPYPALFAALVWISYPLALWSTKQPNSEIPFTPVLYGAVLLLWSGLARRNLTWPLAIGTGLLLGFAMLIRPIALGAGVILALGLRFGTGYLPRSRRFILIGMLLLGNLLMILPWQLWVYNQTGQVILLSTGGAPSIRDGLTFAVNPKSYREGVIVPEAVAVLSSNIMDRGSQIQSTSELLAVVATEGREQPLALLQLIVLKAARSWYATDSQRFELPILILQLLYLLPILVATWTTWRMGGKWRNYTLMVWLLVGYFWGMTTLVLSIVRYMFPMMGLLFVLLPGLIMARRSRTHEPLRN
ncbi:MAG: ArnT family glycosyltransferase [Oscillochloridaceae bacterium umkhey_bin13]